MGWNAAHRLIQWPVKYTSCRCRVDGRNYKIIILVLFFLLCENWESQTSYIYICVCAYVRDFTKVTAHKWYLKSCFATRILRFNSETADIVTLKLCPKNIFPWPFIDGWSMSSAFAFAFSFWSWPSYPSLRRRNGGDGWKVRLTEI